MALKRPVDEGDDLRRYSYRERSSRVHPSRQKISVTRPELVEGISGTCPPLADQCLKILRVFVPCALCLLSVSVRCTLPAVRCPSAIRAGIQKTKSEILRFFYNFLTPYFTTTYLFSVSSVTSVANLFFDQTRSFAPLWGDCFFVPVWSMEFLFSYSESCVLSSVFFFLWISDFPIWGFFK